MKNAVFAVVAALCLTACATVQTPEEAAQRALIARAAYCSLPELTRQAIRAKATDGLQFIVCPGDVVGQ